MTSWCVRSRFGRGAGQVLVAVPATGLSRVQTVRFSATDRLIWTSLALVFCLIIAVSSLSSRVPSATQVRDTVAIRYWETDPVNLSEPDFEIVETRGDGELVPVEESLAARPTRSFEPEIPLPAETRSEISAVPSRATFAVARLRIDPVQSRAKPSAVPNWVAARRLGNELPVAHRTLAPSIESIGSLELAPPLFAQVPVANGFTTTGSRFGLGAPFAPASGPVEVAGVPSPPPVGLGLPPAPAPAPIRLVESLAPKVITDIPELPQARIAGTGSGEPGWGIEGVPLESLPTCRSRQQEDLLKLRLLSRAGTRKSCIDESGTYRFLETKNLNAFLMRVQPGAMRELGNRCDELAQAQACLVDQFAEGIER